MTVHSFQLADGSVHDFDIPDAPKQDMSWGDVASQAVSNIPSSGVQFAQDVVTPLTQPVETAKSLYNLGLGVAQKFTKGTQPNEKIADAVGQYFVNRYGDVNNLKQTIAKDPVGFASDLSTVITGGGALATKAGKVAKLGGLAKKLTSTGNIAKNVASYTDPLSLAGKGIGKISQGVGVVAPAVLGMTTGVGGEAVKTAYNAGKTGSKAFLENMRGQVPIDDVLFQAKEALANIKNKRGAEYAKEIGISINDPATLNFEPIAQKTMSTIENQYYKDIPKVGKDTMDKINEMVDIVGEFQARPDLHTAGGFDALKQRLGDVKIPMDNKQAEFARTELYNAAKDAVTRQAPQYAQTMKNYGEASDLIKELEKTFSLKKGVSNDTQLRKLQSVMRNNANTNYGQRVNLAQELEKAGSGDIMNSLAGQALNNLAPRGLQSIAASGAGVASFTNPSTLAYLPLASPRAVGEVAYKAGEMGKLAKSLLDWSKINKVDPSTMANLLLQMNRTNQNKGE